MNDQTSFLRSERGAATSEYALLLALFLLVVTPMAALTGAECNKAFDNAGKGFSGLAAAAPAAAATTTAVPGGTGTAARPVGKTCGGGSGTTVGGSQKPGPPPSC